MISFLKYYLIILGFNWIVVALSFNYCKYYTNYFFLL